MLLGFLAGSAIASASQPPPARYSTSGRDSYAAKKRREAERAQELAARSQPVAVAQPAPQLVVIPAGCGPGSTFTVTYNGLPYNLVVPPHLQAGQSMPVVFPAAVAPSPVAAPVAQTVVVLPPSEAPEAPDAPNASSQDMCDVGRCALLSANSSDDALPLMHCVHDHIVDASVTQQHNIISMRKGDACRLINGTLDAGLAAPYNDYVFVRLVSDREEGLVSRFVLRP